MSVIAGIAADSEGRADLGQGMVAAGARIADQGWNGTASGAAYSSGQDGTETMRSSWRAQFTALVQGNVTSTTTGTGTELGGAEAEPITQKTAGNTSSALSSLSSADSALRWRLAAGQGNGSATSATSALPACSEGVGVRTSLASQRLRPSTAHQEVASKHARRETDAGETAAVAAQASLGNDSLSQVLPPSATWAAPARTAADARPSDATNTAGNSAPLSSALAGSAEASPPLAASRTLHSNSGGAGPVNLLEPESSSSEIQADGAREVPGPGQPQIANQPESHFGDSAAGSNIGNGQWQTSPIVPPAAAPAGSADHLADTLSETQTHSAFAFPNVGAGFKAAPSSGHATIPSTAEGAKTLDGGFTDAATGNSAETETNAQVSSSGRVRVQAAAAQQAPVQGQSQMQAQPASQAVESASSPSASNQAAPGIAPDDAVFLQAPAAPPKQGNLAVAGAASASGQVSPRPSSRVSTVEHGIHPDLAQPNVSVADTSILPGSQAVPRDAMSATGGTAQVAANSAAASAETFAALDSASGPTAPGWTHAGARHAEAGFQDPVLGWVGVRADVGAGGVHATVIPGSADAAQALGEHMAGLSAHLSDEHTHVETLTLAVPESKDAGLATGQNSSQGMNQGTNQGTGQGREQSSFSESSSSPQAVTPASSATAPLDAQVSALNSALGTNAGGTTQQGIHISVVA